jgi:hypothetical protein
MADLLARRGGGTDTKSSGKVVEAPPKVILLDIDGTIYNSEAGIEQQVFDGRDMPRSTESHASLCHVIRLSHG